MEFKKPPVVEIVADWHFKSSGLRSWSVDEACSFLKEIADEPKGFELLGMITVNPTDGVDGLGEASADEFTVEKSIERIRTWSRDRTTCYQIAENRLIINKVKTTKYSPRYRDLRETAMAARKAYIDRFESIDDVSLTLRYLDDVEIVPATESSGVSLSDYFTINLNYPHHSDRAMTMISVRLG